MFNNGFYKPRTGSEQTSAQTPERAVVQSPESYIPPDISEPMPETVESQLYIPGYLSTQIGKYMRVEFLVGNNLTDRVGRLIKVGASYILLEAQNGDNVICDLFSVKFITIIQSPQLMI